MWWLCCNRVERGKDYFFFGEETSVKSFSSHLPLTPRSEGPEATAVQNADDGCSPQKMKTVKGVHQAWKSAQAVGAVETSEWNLLVLAY